jgi:hypothetical protein
MMRRKKEKAAFHFFTIELLFGHHVRIPAGKPTFASSDYPTHSL